MKSNVLKIVVACIVPYAFMAFTLWQWNVALWNAYERGIVAIMTLTFVAVVRVLFEGETFHVEVPHEPR